MPQDDVKPCPHCGGTGEVRGETLAATPLISDEGEQHYGFNAEHRTVQQVLNCQGGPYGCCTDYADMRGCSCLEDAKRYEASVNLADKIERARAITVTPAMQEEQRQSWARSAMQDEEHGTFTPQPPFRVTMRHHSGIGAPGEISAFDNLREARRSVQQWRIETQGAWQYTIADANGNIIPNDTGCSICTDPNCGDPCGKH